MAYARSGRPKSRKLLWFLFAACIVAGAAYAGSVYFNNFSDFLANPNCKSDCWENGKRVR